MVGAGFWLVACTKSRREGWAAENIERQGFTTYRPLVALELSPKHIKIESLFPGYLFVYTPKGQWQVLKSTFGVFGLVLTGGEPARMPEVEINRMRAREGEDGFVVLPPTLQPRRRPRKGDTVRVRGGPFENQQGVCVGTRGVDRSQVLLDFMGGKVPVLLRDDDLDFL